MKVRHVRVFTTETSQPPIDITDVRDTYVVDGLYTVVQANGFRYRFPTSKMLYASETPPRRPT